MSSMTIKCEFLVGTSIEDAIRDAREKARMFNVAYIEFKFNGVNMSIGQKAGLISAHNAYILALKSKDKLVVES